MQLYAQTVDAWERSGLGEIATIDRELMVPMRDGIRLSTSVIHPKNVNEKLPVILIRTPYDKSGELDDRMFRPFLKEGFAVVLQNERGTGWSEGKHQFLAGARNDGYDTISWIVQQSWSNGKVGTYGCSSMAEHQLALAAMNHPAHRAMVAMGPGSAVGDIPGVTTQGGFYKGGVPMIEWEGWYRSNGELNRPKLPSDISQEERVRLSDIYSPWPSAETGKKLKEKAQQSIRELPSAEILRRAGIPATDFDILIKLSPADPHWRELDLIHNGDHPLVPALYIDAWHDFTSFGTVKLFEYLQHTPNQFLIVAPTEHCAMQDATENTIVGERSMGDARFDYDGLILKWFDYWLNDKPSDVLDRPKVQAYLMGANAWKTYDSWPVPNITRARFYLHGAGRANSVVGSGQLSSLLPTSEAPDGFTSDPLHPVPSTGGGDTIPVVQDQFNVEMRNDVLVYSTDPLKEGTAVTGEIRVVLFVSSTAPDADLAVKLVDVYPDGKAFNVADTMLRLRYRNGFSQPSFMKAGDVYRVELAGLITSNYFAPGHRIRLQIAGSNFPMFERNLQTGGQNYNEIEPKSAIIQIHHANQNASFIEFPVIER